ncbi:unnamed protein product, partial [Phaeothamnion confervicola]
MGPGWANVFTWEDGAKVVSSCSGCPRRTLHSRTADGCRGDSRCRNGRDSCDCEWPANSNSKCRKGNDKRRWRQRRLRQRRRLRQFGGGRAVRPRFLGLNRIERHSAREGDERMGVCKTRRPMRCCESRRKMPGVVHRAMQ